MFGSLNTYMNMRSEAHQVEIRYSCCSLVCYEVTMLHVSSLLRVPIFAFISFAVKLHSPLRLRVFFPLWFLKIDKTWMIADNFFWPFSIDHEICIYHCVIYEHILIDQIFQL